MKFKYSLYSLALIMSMACSTSKTVVEKASAKEEVSELFAQESEVENPIIEEEDMTPAVEKDSLAFLKINPVDVRWDLNDSIQPEFKSNLDKLVNAWYAENSFRTTAYEGPKTKYVKKSLPIRFILSDYSPFHQCSICRTTKLYVTILSFIRNAEESK